MDPIRKSLLYITLFLIYTQGLWERLFFLHPIVSSALIDVPVILFLTYPVKFRLKKSPGLYTLFFFIFVSFISSYVNQDGAYNWLKYIRYLVFFVLIYNQLWHITFSDKEWKNLFAYLAFLIILQGIGASTNLFILKIQHEGHVGFMSSLGGTTATTFPLIISSLCMLIYLSFLPRNNLFILLIAILVFSAFLVSYQSGKRATYFLLPAFVGFIIFYNSVTRGNSKRYLKKLGKIFIVLWLLFPVFIFGIKSSRGLNYDLTGNENNIEVIQNAIKYAIFYETNVHRVGTTGRTGTSRVVLKNSVSSRNSFFFGHGVGSIKDNTKTFRSGIEYGFVGFTRDLFSIGWISSILVIIIISQMTLTNRSYHLFFTRTIRITILISFLIIHFFYSSDFVVHLKIVFMLSIILAFINSPKHKDSLENLVIKNFR